MRPFLRAILSAVQRHRPWLNGLVLAVAGVWALRGWWQEGLPIGDFQGIAGWTWYLWASLREWGRVPAWSPYWFNGGTFLTLWAPLSCFLALPFVALWGLVTGLKVLWVASTVLSGWLMYLVVQRVLRDRGAALVAALVYVLHPSHLGEVAFYTHTEAILEFVTIPPLFFCYWRALEEPRRRWPVATAFILAATLLAIGAEFTTLLGVGLVGLFLGWAGGRALEGWRGKGKVPWGTLGRGFMRSVAIVLAAAGLSAFWLLPLWEALPASAFISPEESRAFALRLSLDDPILLLDRAGHFLLRTAPEHVLKDAYGLPEQGAAPYLGLFYLGAVAFTLALVPWVLQKGKDWGIGAFGWAVVGGGLWLSAGSYSLYAITGNGHNRLHWLWSGFLWAGDKVLLGAVALGLAGAVAVGAWRRWGQRLRRPRCLLLALLALGVLGPFVLWVKPLDWLGRMLPVLGHLRVPLRFYLLVVPALALLAGWGVATLRQVLRPAAFRAVWAVLAALVVLDFAPYAKFSFLQWPLEDLEETYAPFAEDAETYALGSVYANGVLGDYGLTLARKPIVWGWLEWAAPRGRRGFVHGLAALGWDALEDAEGAKDLAALLAVSNARYLVHPWVPDADYVRLLAGTPYFRLTRVGRRFAVLENRMPADYVQLYSAVALYWDTRSGPDDRAWEARLARLVARVAPRGVAVVEAASLESPSPYRFVALDAEEGDVGLPPGVLALVLPEEGGALRQEVDRLVPGAVARPRREVRWERPSPEEIRVQVGPGEPCLLTVAESWYPRWQVWQDGRASGVPLRVNGGFQGVWLDGEAHDLAFRFVPGPARAWGWAVTGLTLALGGAWGIWGWRRRR